MREEIRLHKPVVSKSSLSISLRGRIQDMGGTVTMAAGGAYGGRENIPEKIRGQWCQGKGQKSVTEAQKLRMVRTRRPTQEVSKKAGFTDQRKGPLSGMTN